MNRYMKQEGGCMARHMEVTWRDRVATEESTAVRRFWTVGSEGRSTVGNTAGGSGTVGQGYGDRGLKLVQLC